jgi:acetyl-CoA synthetase
MNADYWRHRRTPAHLAFRAARDLLLAHRGDHDGARRRFRWPRLGRFNWALEWFDVVAADNPRSALVLLDGRGGEQVISFAELSARSDAVATWLRRVGVRRGDRILLVLGQRAELWECLLACLKVGAVVIPAYTSLTAAEVADRVPRGDVAHVICDAGLSELFEPVALRTRVAVGGAVRGWLNLADSRDAGPFLPGRPTAGGEIAFGYFTSGTTARPKLVAHTHTSYPVGHLSSMYWNGVLPGDRHLNVSAPGWAKHSWSGLFVPWNAEATIVALPDGPPPVAELPVLLARHRVDSFCAPPSVWRPLAAHVDTASARPRLREATSAGEPLDAPSAAVIARAWRVAVRDGYGQTETTALIGTTPGMAARPGWLGRPLPGYTISLRDPETGLPGRSGEVCVELCEAPVGMAAGYLGEPGTAFGGDYYRTGDLGERDARGFVRVVGRRDDVFKSFDHRVSPYELEAVLRQHPAVDDVAVIPRPHPVGGATPHAVVVPLPDHAGDGQLADALLRHVARHCPPETRARSVEFADRLPKTGSGKVRRAALRVGARCFAIEDTTGGHDAQRPGVTESAVGA